jgi:hypothetical protein
MTSDGVNIVDLPVAFVKICRAFMELLSSIADADRKLSVCFVRWWLWRCVRLGLSVVIRNTNNSRGSFLQF